MNDYGSDVEIKMRLEMCLRIIENENKIENETKNELKNEMMNEIENIWE